MASSFAIDRAQLSAALVELNSMSLCDGVVMTRDGVVKAGYETDAETLCMLVTAPALARKLTAAGLSSYTDKELKKWVSEVEIEPLQAIVDAALAAE